MNKREMVDYHHAVDSGVRSGEVVDADHGAGFVVKLVHYIGVLLQQVVIVP
jgi:hypothetical protein